MMRIKEPYSDITYNNIIVDLESLDWKDKLQVKSWVFFCFLVGIKLYLEQGEPLRAESYTLWADKVIRNELKKKFIGEL